MNSNKKQININRFRFLFVMLGGLLMGCVSDNEIVIDGINSKGDIPLKLYVIDGGEIVVSDMSLFDSSIDKGTEEIFANNIYLIKHPDGILLWDTGLSDSLVEYDQGMQIMNGALTFKLERTLEEQLAEIDIKPSDIDYLAFSNLHPVFTGNISYFTNAKVLLQEEEYIQAFSNNAENFGYNPDNYSYLKDMSINQLDGNYDVFGDGSFIIIAAPATSLGHQVFYINLPNTGPIITAGDLYNSQEMRDNYTIQAHIPDKEKMAESFIVIDNLLEKTGAQLWLNHDIEQNALLNHSPTFYE